jgi:glycosyltransferase involved in cell wall biosynthesis
VTLDVSLYMKKIIFFTSSHKIGLTGQLTEQALSFGRVDRNDFFFLSGEREQYPGLFERLDSQHIKYKKIEGLDIHASFFKLVKEFGEYAANLAPDIVTVHTNWQLAVVVAAKYLFRKQYKIVYIVHGYRHNYRFRSVAARALIGTALWLFADRVITPSSFLKRQFRFLGDKNEIIFIGEDEELFKAYPLPVFSGTKRLIFAAEFRAGKNQESLIKVLKQYIEISGDTDVELYLPGKGEKLEECRHLAKRLNIDKHVVFPGFLNRSEMLNLYLKCQFAVVPTNVETFGHCIVEPFILGRVVISRHVGVADDIIAHGKTGFLFDGPGDLLELLLAILPDKELCKAVSANAYERRHLFKWDRICNQHSDLVFDRF